MAIEMSHDLAGYHELGSHRHLVISERLRGRRRELGLTQKEVVARLRRMGVATTNKALSSLEHGAGLDVCKLPEIARALECSLTYLVGLTDDPAQWEPDGDVWPRNPQPAAAPGQAAPGGSAPDGSAPDRSTPDHSALDHSARNGSAPDPGGRLPRILGPLDPERPVHRPAGRAE